MVPDFPVCSEAQDEIIAPIPAFLTLNRPRHESNPRRTARRTPGLAPRPEPRKMARVLYKANQTGMRAV